MDIELFDSDLVLKLRNLFLNAINHSVSAAEDVVGGILLALSSVKFSLFFLHLELHLLEVVRLGLETEFESLNI